MMPFRQAVAAALIRKSAARSTGRPGVEPLVESLESRTCLAYTPLAIAHPAPQVRLTVAATAAAGAPTVAELAALPADPAAPITGWTIDWGDGTVQSLAGTATTASHTYGAAARYAIHAAASDAYGTYQADDGVPDASFATGNVAPDASASAPGRLVIAPADSYYNDLSDMQVDATRHTTYLLSDTYFSVVRVLADGVVDPTWGKNGVAEVYLDSYSHLVGKMVVLSDGGVLVAGGFAGNFWCVKYTAAGQPDSSFGQGGIAKIGVDFSSQTGAKFVLPQADGKILLVGTADAGQVWVRLNPDGSPDGSFGAGGVRKLGVIDGQIGFDAVVQLADGRLLAALPQQGANRVTVVRLSATGTPDPSFGLNGVSDIARPGQGELDQLVVQPDGKIVGAGWFYPSGNISDSLVVRLTADGQLDPTYGVNGIVALPLSNNADRFNDVALTPDGGAVATGYAILDKPASSVYVWSAATLVKLTPAGQLDANSAGGGLQYDNPTERAEYGRAVRVLDGDWLVAGADSTVVPTQHLTLRRFLAHVPSVTVLMPPTASAGGPYTVAEGASVLLDARSSVAGSGTLTGYAWDFDYDGATFQTDATGATAAFSAAGLDGPATRLVALRVTDSNGLTVTATTTLAVANAAPTARFSASIPTVTLGRGTIVGFNAQADVAADVAAGFGYGFDFDNDGVFEITDATGPAAEEAGVPAAYLATVGAHVVRGRITDKDGGYTDYTTTVTVTAAPPPVDLKTASLAGTAFNDANGNGVKDAADTVAGGKVIFLDADNDGVLDPGETSVTTAGNGAFGFTGLAAGTYHVRRVFPGGYAMSTAPIDVTLAAGQAVGGLSIGSKASTVVTPPAAATLSGFVFDDANKNGVYDATETKASGKTVFLDANNNGKLDAGEKSVTTGSGGVWSFTGLAAGVYHVRRVFPSGYAQSNAPVDVTLTAGQVVSGLSIGSRSGAATPPANTASISGFAFNDANKNGLYDGTDTLAAGKTVFLDLDDDGIKDANEVAVVTDSKGTFGFKTLAAGTYHVRRVFPSGYVESSPPRYVTLTSGQAATGLSIGSRTA